ncbi:MAG: hypothetical protein JWR09_4954 [Mucilaginibacter sp.]|nr:hypothetical protein [Mucilaginibacter sp.]
MSSKELGKILGGKVDPGDTTSVGTSNSTTTSLATETEQIAETEVDQIP